MAYVLVLGLILAASWLLIRRSFRAKDAGFDWHMFFLGAAFMLVEVKSIAELSLLFGSTWLVNSAVFSGILLMILAANAVVARRAAVKPAGSYGWLGASLLVPYLTGLSWLNAWPFAWRAAVGALATSVPIFFAGMVFATSFKRTREASGALAANMFGALIGGMLEYSSMVMGIRGLTVLALLLYSLFEGDLSHVTELAYQAQVQQIRLKPRTIAGQDTAQLAALRRIPGMDAPEVVS